MINDKLLKKFWLNSHKPYAHGNWTNGKITIGNEEALTGRNKLILDEFEKIIKNKFNTEQIKKMRLLDIGSYDGQTSVEIEKRLPFKEIVSVEPRKKNYIKGKFVRDFLDIKTNIKFENLNLEDVKENFDIVFCVGVLHHLDNINDFLKKISKICGKSIFIECLSYNPKNNLVNYLLKKLNKKIIEPKDLIYKFREKTVGISGHKLETNYYDGSTLQEVAVVTIPDNEFIKQVLYVNGFTSKILVSDKNYYKHIKSNFRNFSATIIYASRDNNYNPNRLLKKYIYSYEKKYLTICLNDKLLSLIESYNFLLKYILKLFKKSKFEYELLLNIKYSVKDKINFEKAKIYLNNKKTFRSTRALYKIISSYKSDYRTCYRAFALLAFIYRKNKDKKKLFLDLLKNCNHRYPIEIIDELEEIYKKS
jgi:SAM-dependent methyltransferase